MQVSPQLADVVDADLVADRLDEIEVGMRPALDAPAVPDQRTGERNCGGTLADSGRPVEEVRVRGALVGERGAKEPLRLGLLRNVLEDVHGSPRAVQQADACRRPA